MDDIAETLTWPFRDHSWLPKTFIQGLMLLVPVVGAIAMMGWMMESLDNLRAGRDELARAALHLKRGWPIFAAAVAYCAVIAIVSLVLVTAGGGHRGIFALAQLWNIAAPLGFAFIFPALVLRVDREGFGAGLDVAAVIQTSLVNPRASLGAAMICILAAALGLLGLVACGLGVVFTEAYAGTVIVAAVAWFERHLESYHVTT